MRIFLTIISALFLTFTSFAQCGDAFVDDCASDLGNAIYLKDFKV